MGILLSLRVRRRRWSVCELEGDVVHVAPVPVLAGLERPDDRVANRESVFGCVSPRRAVAATDVTARLTQPKMDPVAQSMSKAVLAARRRRNDGTDPIKVGAGRGHGTVLSLLRETAAQ